MGETSVTKASGNASGAAGASAQQDGRITRAARTRASVVEALLTLNRQGDLRPTARDIANQAGVSLRSLYVHFDDLEALFVAASQRHAEYLGQVLPPVVTEGDLPERLDAFLERRVQIHELGAGVRRAALLQEPFSPVLRKALASGRQIMRSEVARSFAPEIAAASSSGDRLALALDIAASSAAWEALRTHQQLSLDDATAHVRAMILAFIAAWTPGTAAATHPATDTATAADTTDDRRHVR